MDMNISEIRLKNARYLANSAGGISAFAEKTGKSQPQISHLIGEKPIKNIGNKIAREIEKSFNQEKDWLDHAHYDLWEISKTVSFLPDMQTTKVNKIQETPYGLTQEAIEFAKAWQELPPEEQDTLAAFVYARQKSNKKVA
jgi:hypothetical protein